VQGTKNGAFLQNRSVMSGFATEVTCRFRGRSRAAVSVSMAACGPLMVGERLERGRPQQRRCHREKN
jgi:hypothetical protein